MSPQQNFAELYKEQYSSIYRFMLSRVGDDMTAEDLAGEVFFKAWRGRASFKQPLAPRAWLYQIARNTLTDHWRKTKTFDLDPEFANQIASDQPLPQVALVEQERETLVANALEQLAGIQKSVAILRFIHRLPAREVATLLNIKEGNVRVVQYRALKQLKEIVHYEDL